MVIKKIRISNFKSFNDLEIELGNFNILIGANASGKSNFIQIFRFLKDIANEGLENAISMQGGVEYLRNINIGSSKNFSLEVVCNIEEESSKMFKNARTGMWDIKGEIYEVIYEFDIRFSKENLSFEICKDKIIKKCKFFELDKELEQGEIILSYIDRKVQQERKNFPAEAEIVFGEKDYSLPEILREGLSYNTLLLQTPFSYPLDRAVRDVSIYNFAPESIRKSAPIIGKAELEENGSNLALVLKNVLEDKEKKRKISNLINYLLPFVEDLEIEKFADKSLLFKLRESYFKNQYLPAFLLSDGTINITALIIALYFEKKPLTIIEEPERNIHPYLISKVVEMMKEVSLKKQIIVTTHNPEIVKHADLKDILLISRDKEGFSVISKPAEKKEVRIFLENEIGIDDLYVRNLLGV
ncbi:MAG: AAA family ATPase [Nitrospirota bacterium]